MHVNALKLDHFRNYQNLSLDFNPHFNLIIGSNGHGKTNLLEAIFYLAYLNSFRTSQKQDLILNNQNAESSSAIIQALVEKAGREYDIRIQLSDKSRQLKLNGKRPQLYKDYFGLVPILLFEPRDVYLFRDSPSGRRKFINRSTFLNDAGILKTIKDYDAIVTQKNRLLKEGDPAFVDDQLDIWNQQLAKLGAQIVYRRLEWIAKINEIYTSEYQHISETNQAIQLRYQSKVNYSESFDQELSDLEAQLSQALTDKKADEKIRRESLIGPHRDDFMAFLADQPIGQMGSQGENRSAMIALKSAEVHLFEKTHEFPPLFLLDDVASELDFKRVKALFSYLRTTQAQVFLTTTEPDLVASHFSSKGTSFLVEQGKVSVLGY